MFDVEKLGVFGGSIEKRGIPLKPSLHKVSLVAVIEKGGRSWFSENG